MILNALNAGNLFRERDLFQFGAALEAGISLFDAVEIVADGGESYPVRRAFSFFLTSLQQGNSVSDMVFKPEIKALPLWFRIVLGSDLSDVEKGNLIVSRIWAFRKEAKNSQLAIAMIQAQVLILNALAMIMFVLPQFSSIFRGMNLRLPWITRLVIQTTNFFEDWWFVLIPAFPIALGITLFLVRRLFSAGVRASENLFFLKSLGKVPTNRWPRIVSILGHSSVLPITYKAVESVAEGFQTNDSLFPIFRKVGLSERLAWFLEVVFRFPQNQRHLEELADYAKSMIELKERRLAKLISVGSTLGFALFMGIFSFATFLPLINLIDQM